jgi:uncharacterized membrane protein YkvA (DUF1232 family)
VKRLSAFATLWQALRGRRRPDAPPLSEQLLALPRLVLMTLRGAYPGLDRGRLLLMGLALAYVVSPVDLVPEALFLLAGMGDDAVVLSWLAGTVLVETERFLAWEGSASPAARHRHGVVPGQVL